MSRMEEIPPRQRTAKFWAGLCTTLLFFFLFTAWVGSAFNVSAATPRLIPTPDGFPKSDEQDEWTERLDDPARTRIRFESLTVENGLSQSTVMSIIQDHKGFMWFATLDGLNKYDGYIFKTFNFVPGNETVLSHRQIRSIVEDANGNLWIGTEGGGLVQFNPSTNQFFVYQQQAEDEYSLTSDFVTQVYLDRRGDMWVGTLDGLNRYDPQTRSFTRYRHSPDDRTSISDNHVVAIYEDRQGAIWVGTEFGGLNKFDRETQNFTHYRHHEKNSKSLGSDSVQAIYEDRNGDLWIGTAGGGLNLFDRDSESFIRYVHNPDDPTSLSSDFVTSIYQDSLGDFWIGTYGGGLNYFSRDRGIFLRYVHEMGNPESLNSDYILSLYEDRTGVLWIGTNGGGLNKLERLAPRFVHIHASLGNVPGSSLSLNNDNVRVVYEDRTGVIWIGTNGGGLNMWDRSLGTWKYYKHDPDNPNSISNDIVQAIVEDDLGYLWVGTERGGLNRFDRSTGQFVRYQREIDDPESLSDDNILSLYNDKVGNLWVGTRGGGLNRFDRTSGKFEHFFSSEKLDEVQFPNVRAIYEDLKGNLWFGIGNDGLYRLNSGKVMRYQAKMDNGLPLEDYIVLSIHEDQAGFLWIGTFGSGLLKLNQLTGVFTQFREKDGLPNDIVYGILEDERGNLWLSTNNGLSQFDPISNHFTNYNTDDGLQSKEFNPGSFFKGRRGEMFFGGINGFNIFEPDTVGDGNPYVPSIVLTSLRQDDQDLFPERAVDDISEFSLHWPNNNFEFEFVALSYIRSENNHYAYMLENFDRDWNYVGTKRNGRYTNLPSGNYTLHLKACNNDGIWNDKGISVKVKVIPPFWETWWFASLVVMTLFAAVIGGYRLRVRNVEVRSQELESLVDERTSELSKMNYRLEQEIRERKRIEVELAQRAAETAVTAERSRLARELHDAVTQTLFSASLIAEALPSSMEHDPEEGRSLLDELRGLSRGALAEMRTLLLELRPTVLVEANLADLLRQLAEAASGREGIPVEVISIGSSSLPCDVHIALYRIAQEALNNVVKHARAKHINIHLSCKDVCLPEGDMGTQVVLKIQDDGRGFNPGAVPPNHLGLSIMRERALAIGADLSIESQPEQGTRIIVYWHGDGRKENR